MTPITNSEIACFQRCEREWQHRYLDRREGLVPAETLSRGKRMHGFLAEWWRGFTGALDQAEMPPIERAMLLGYHAFYQRPHIRDVRVNVPFRVTIGGVEMVGECDAVGIDQHGETVIVEHKTTSHDVAPGSAWWRERIHCDSQPSTYLAAFPGATVLYDVLHVPSLRPLQANSKRAHPESDEEYIARVLSDMAERPEKYFQRATIVRLDAEREAFEDDVHVTAMYMRNRPALRVASPELMKQGRDLERFTPRNPRSCFTYGRACDFFEACWQGKDIESYPKREMNHSEEMLAKWEASR
jgi:hypothetical protein